jgi:hypothetical protein
VSAKDKDKSAAILLSMCTDSEKQIAKLEWLSGHATPRRPLSPEEIKGVKDAIQAMEDVHESLKAAYEKASGKNFQSKMKE